MFSFLNAMPGIEKVSSPLPSHASKASKRKISKERMAVSNHALTIQFFKKYKSVYKDIGHSRPIPHSLNFFFLNQSV